MDEWIKSLKALIRQLDNSPSVQNSVEQTSLRLLKAVMAAVEEGDTVRVARRVATLKAFWLESVAWCSQLSKDMEKMLIQYEERHPFP